MIKPMILITLTLASLISTAQASAIDRGDRMERRWDQRGDAVDRQLDRRSSHQSDLGHEARANTLDRRGDHIDARYDRIGTRREARFDRRHR